MTDVFEVFLSYAEEDGALALRLDGDLDRAGRKAYRYEKDAQISAPIPSATRRLIELSRFFCLLDSAHARPSSYVREECAIARARAERGELTFVVCLIQPRTASAGSVWWQDELFEGLNDLVYVDLTDYERGIKKLCAHLGVTYFPRSDIPRDQEFQEEAHVTKLPPDVIAELVGMYTNFRKLYGERPEIAEAQLAVLIDRCERLNVTELASPRLALGVLQATGGKHREACATFDELRRILPEDPRAWAGSAGARFHLGDYESALDAYQRCQRLLDREPPEYQWKMAHNLASTLLALGRANEAWEVLSPLPDEPYIRATKGEALLSQGCPEQALPFLEQAFRSFCESQDVLPNPSSLILRLADCHRALRQSRKELALLERASTFRELQKKPEILLRMAQCYLGNRRLDRALECLDAAVALAPESLVYRAQRALLLHLSGDAEAAQREAHRCLSPEDENPRERYYRGLAFHLLGVEAPARTELRRSRLDPAISSWPDYASLLRSS